MTSKNSGNFLMLNPDGSSTLMQAGEPCWIGGRILHIGSAALPWRVRYSLDPHKHHPFQKGQRQRESVQAMARAFRSDTSLQKEPIDEAALEMEVDFTLNRGSDISKSSVNESVLMSSQRWIITALPSDIVQQVLEVVLLYRDALRENVPLVQLGTLPNAQAVFQTMIPGAKEETRPDIIALLNTLLSDPDHVNCHVFSEPDRRIISAWRGFKRLPKASTLKDLSPAASASEIIQYVNTRAGWMDTQTCYWCETNSLSCDLKLCISCRAVSYCGKDCQVQDWKAFHRNECKQLVSGKTRKDLGMDASRLATLKMDGAQRASFPMPIASPGDSDSLWRGDLFLLYLIGPMDTSEHGPCLGQKTRGFPRGCFIRPREQL
jgi:hypothetical protein